MINSFAKSDSNFLSDIKLGEKLTKHTIVSDLLIAVDPLLMPQFSLFPFYSNSCSVFFFFFGCRYFWNRYVLSGCQIYCHQKVNQ